MINFKILSLATVATLALGFAPAQANDLMSNAASGYVEGNIISNDFSRGSFLNSSRDILIGGIAVSDTAFYNTASGSVNGNVTQMTSDALEAKIHVGSIKAQSAMLNRAEGAVNGNIAQYVGQWGQGVISIGAIDAENDGQAFNNRASGFVNGSVYQNAGGFGASSLINVGSVTSSETLR